MDKFCRNCGTKMNEGDRFCQNCGTDSQIGSAPVQNNVNNAQPNYNAQVAPRKTNGMAVAGFVCSMVGIIVFGLIMGVLAICFGAAGLNRIKSYPNEGGKGLAIAAVIVGIIEVIIMIYYYAVLGRYGFFHF